MFLKLVFLISVVQYVYCDVFSIIKRCPRNSSESELNDCVVKNGNLALSYILHGIPELHIPSFLPLHYILRQKFAENLEFTFTGKINMSHVNITSADVHVKSCKINLGLTHLRPNSHGHFTINGTIDNKPAFIQGLANISYDEQKAQYFGQGRRYKVNETYYTHIVQSTTTLKNTGYHYCLYHLKSNITAEQNRTLNYDLDNKLGDALDIAFTRIANNSITLVINAFLKLIPLDQLLT